MKPEVADFFGLQILSVKQRGILKNEDEILKFFGVQFFSNSLDIWPFILASQKFFGRRSLQQFLG